MKPTQSNGSNETRYRRHGLLSTTLAALTLMIWTPGVLVGQCWRITENTALYEDRIESCVYVAAWARLKIIDCTLTLDGDKGTTSTVHGEIWLQEDGAELAFTEKNHKLTGNGEIDGQHNSAKITLGNGRTLTSKITIEGNCQIGPVPGAAGTTFVNGSGGLVHANNAGTLHLNVHSLGSPSGTWRVSSSASAILEFSVGSTTMTGDFTVNEGTLNIDASVGTSGRLIFCKNGSTNPKINVAGSGVSFKASQP